VDFGIDIFRLTRRVEAGRDIRKSLSNTTGDFKPWVTQVCRTEENLKACSRIVLLEESGEVCFESRLTAMQGLEQAELWREGGLNRSSRLRPEIMPHARQNHASEDG